MFLSKIKNLRGYLGGWCIKEDYFIVADMYTHLLYVKLEILSSSLIKCTGNKRQRLRGMQNERSTD